MAQCKVTLGSRNKKWIPHFHSADVKLLVLVYLFCSAIATAFCMRLPLGNVVLGTLAGGYVGRRAYHATQSRESLSKTASRVGLFAASVTGAWALLIGLLALDEEMVELLQVVVGLERVIIAGPVGVGLVILFCVVLMIVQILVRQDWGLDDVQTWMGRRCLSHGRGDSHLPPCQS
jgi:hypothetical protein